LLPLGFADEENATEQAKQRCEDAKENPSSQSRACKCRARVVITIGRECALLVLLCFAFAFLLPTFKTHCELFSAPSHASFFIPSAQRTVKSEQGGE